MEFMAKENKKIQRILLALGLALFLAGITWAFMPPAAEIETYHLVVNCALSLLTAVCVYFALLIQNPVVFYVSANLCILSVLSLILNANSVMFHFKQFWPVVVMIFGVTLLPIGRFHYKKFKTVYVIPSAALTILGAFFLLFTFKIIKMTMREFFGRFMPFVLAASGISLLVLYYARNKANVKFPVIQDDDDDDEGPLLFSEEDI